MSLHNHERGARPVFATCGNCGGYPVGIGCYHICPNSVYYYTPEQERYDDAIDDGSDDRRERFAATIEASQYEEDYDDQADADYLDHLTEDELASVSPFQVIGALVYDADTDTLDSIRQAEEIRAGMTITPSDTDDIPF